MASGFLELAYLGEIAIVFNLAYHELRADRYFERLATTIKELKSKLEPAQDIAREHTDLFHQLDNIDSPQSSRRRKAWTLDDHDRPLFTWLLAGPTFGAFNSGKDKKYCMWALGIVTAIMILITTLDHLHVAPDTDILGVSCWWFLASLLVASLLYPVITIWFGRAMRKHIELVADTIENRFRQINRPAILDMIKAAGSTVEPLNKVQQ